MIFILYFEVTLRLCFFVCRLLRAQIRLQVMEGKQVLLIGFMQLASRLLKCDLFMRRLSCRLRRVSGRQMKTRAWGALKRSGVRLDTMLS